ncbi:dsRBD fold-containing protein [Microbispora sp. ZYX-F-249]|uniref:DsRBD fold-containing protein n=1 Tax=Microbispora maris TaxID=3144104 RepID=A0ABV0B144_9ACTN
MGDELATARALADMTDKLLVITSKDIAQVAPPAERNSLW